MNHINYSFFRNNMASVFDQVNQAHTPVVITRQNAKPAVVISLEDFASYEATAHLMSSHKNATRLNKAIKEIENGKSIKHDLIEE